MLRYYFNLFCFFLNLAQTIYYLFVKFIFYRANPYIIDFVGKIAVVIDDFIRLCTSRQILHEVEIDATDVN